MTQQLKSPWSLFKALDVRHRDGTPSSEEGGSQGSKMSIECGRNVFFLGEFTCFPSWIFLRDNAVG